MKKIDNYYSSHYGESMNPEYMANWAKWVVKDIRKLLKQGKYPVLIYRGMSGVTTATALAMHMDSNDGANFGMIYVRKEDEKSHGGTIETSLMKSAGREIAWIFCDDFIDKGGTALEVIQTVSTRYTADIQLNNVWFALSMSSRFSERSKLNRLFKALATCEDRARAVAKDMRTKHSAWLKSEAKRRENEIKRKEERMKRMEAETFADTTMVLSAFSTYFSSAVDTQSAA